MSVSSDRRRVVLSVADQAVCSLSNVCLILAIARSTSPSRFGLFATLIIVYATSLQLSRALASEPFTAIYSSRAKSDRDHAFRAAAGSVFALGCLVGIVLCTVGVVLGGGWTFPAAIMGALLPALLIQDAYRYLFIAAHRAGMAVWIDCGWLGAELVGFGALRWLVQPDSGEVALLGVWAMAGAGSAGVAMWISGMAPAVGLARDWVTSHIFVIWRYCVEFAAYRLAMQVTMVTVGLVAGLSAVGGLRAVQTLAGPATTVFVGVSIGALASASRIVLRTPDELGRYVALLSAGLGLFGLGWGAVLLLLPESVGHALLGENWDAVVPVLLPYAIFLTAEATVLGPWVGLRALSAARNSLRARLYAAGAIVVFGTVGALYDGLSGAAWGLAAASITSVPVWWWAFHRASVDSLTTIASRPGVRGR